MPVALFAGSDVTLVKGTEVDVRIGEFHTFQAQPTGFAIESGAYSADHIVGQPDGLAISWAISNLDEDGQSYGNRAATVLETLRTRLKDRKLYDVVTRHRLYPSMAVVSVTAENTGPFNGALRGRIQFQQVPKDLLERVKVPAAKVKAKSAATKVDAGRVQPAPVVAPPSLIKQILNGGIK